MFCPFLLTFSMVNSIFIMVGFTFFFSFVLFLKKNSLSKGFLVAMNLSLFPSLGINLIYFFPLFIMLSTLNLTSLMVFSFPVTTTLAFNLCTALVMWFFTMIILMLKKDWFASLLPANSPWYLVPFLSLVEMISITVRPITLCFRLLANMTAGHILLSLICKLPFFAWLLGSLFGILELLVSLVQAFVFLMLISVYLDESLTHWN